MRRSRRSRRSRRAGLDQHRPAGRQGVAQDPHPFAGLDVREQRGQYGDAHLTRAQRAGGDGPGGDQVDRPAVRVDLGDRPGGDARGQGDQDAPLDGVPYRVDDLGRGVARPGADEDDAARARLDGGVQEHRVAVRVVHHHVHAGRQFRHRGQGQRGRPLRGAQHGDLAEADLPEQFLRGVGERVQGHGLGLHGPTRGVHPSGEGDQDAEPAGGGGSEQRVVQVARSVAVRGAHGQLRAGEHDGARVVVVEVDEEGRLLQGVGAVGDDDAVDVGVGEDLVDRAQQGQLVGGGEPGAVDAEQVHHLDGDPLGERGGGHHLAAVGVGREAGSLPAAGYRSAGADDDDASHARPSLTPDRTQF